MSDRLIEAVPAHLRSGLPAPTPTATVMPTRARVVVPRPGRALTDAEVAQIPAPRRADLIERAETLAALAAALDEL